MHIGIIGVGAMGRQMALNLLNAGYEVTAWNRSRGAVDPLVQAGARRAERVEDTFQTDLALSILFDDEAIRTVLLGSGALERVDKTCLHVCMSTISMSLAHELFDVHTSIGLPYVAAPILGRPEAIEQKGLNLLVGGEAANLELLEAPFAALGKTWLIGPNPVQAQIAKLAANFMISGALEAMAEAAAVLQTQGADVERFFSVMGETLFASFVYRSYGPMIAGQAPAAPSGLTLPLKDNGLFLEAAQKTSVKLPLAEAVRSNLIQAAEAGGAELDWSTALAQVAHGQSET